VGTALCDHSLDNYAFFDPNLGCTKLHHNPAPFIRGFMPLTTLINAISQELVLASFKCCGQARSIYPSDYFPT